MVKVLMIGFCLIIQMQASVYKQNCLSCHNKLPVSIDKFFYRYLLTYSSQGELKKQMLSYLQNPKEKNTIMPEAFISRFGIKEKTYLSKEELKSALDEYWDEYKVFGKLE